MEQANAVLSAYLPRFNARFAVPATDGKLGWQAVPAGLSLDECFCLVEERTVALDHTISYHGQRVQLLPTEQQSSWRRAKVFVHAHFDGQLAVFFQGHSLPCRLAPADPAQLRTTERRLSPPATVTAASPLSPTRAHKPKVGHPWAYRNGSS